MDLHQQNMPVLIYRFYLGEDKPINQHAKIKK
jgi:hypothetical protein